MSSSPAPQTASDGRPRSLLLDEGHEVVVPVNIVAPYLLTELIDRPQRLVYLSSSEHYGGRPSVADVDWSGRRAGSYPDSKLFVTTLAAAVARLWPDVFSNAVDPVLDELARFTSTRLF